MSIRIFALVFAVLLILGLSACEPAESGPSPESPKVNGPVTSGGGSLSQGEPDETSGSPAVPGREPIGSPAVILYPELADETLTASALYQQALERPSVILYQTEPLTDPQPVKDFLAAVEKGEDQDLYLYQFRFWKDHDDPYACHLAHFLSDGGKVTVGSDFSYNWEFIEAEGNRAVYSIALNEYGFLVYREEGSSEPVAIQAVNDRALYNNAEECHRLRDTYLRPLVTTALIGRSWSSAAELSETADLVWIFEDLYRNENGSDPWGALGSNWPLDTMAETLSRYFDGVTKEMIVGRKYTDRYDPQTDTIFYEGGRGGMTPELRVTGWTREGDLLEIDYETCDYFSGAPMEGSLCTLTVRTTEDGGFRYLSNLPRE